MKETLPGSERRKFPPLGMFAAVLRTDCQIGLVCPPDTDGGEA